MDFDNRRDCLKTLKKIGYQVGAGFMVGLPGQRAEDLAEDLIFLKELEPDMIGIGPFIPHNATPLKDAIGGTVEDTLVMLAFTRLLVPDCLLPATTAMGTLNPKGREMALKAGANVVMPNLSPTNVRAKYELYENKICTGDEAAHCRQCIEKRINSAGFQVDMGRGDSFKYQKKCYNNKY
jgi:biotin synthase